MRFDLRILAMALFLSACSQWDQKPAAPAAPASRAGEKEARGVSDAGKLELFTSIWCAPKQEASKEAAETVRRIRESVLSSFGDKAPHFETRKAQCDWIASQIILKKELSLVPSDKKTKVELGPIVIFTDLTKLEIPDAKLDEFQLAQLKVLGHLEELRLSDSPELGSLVPIAENFPGLKKLALDGCGISESKALQALEALPLTELSLKSNELSNLYSYLPETLESLDLSGNKLLYVEGLAGLNKLKELNLSDNKIEAFPEFPRYLQVVNVAGNTMALDISALRMLVGDWGRGKYHHLKKVIISKNPTPESKKALETLSADKSWGIEFTDTEKPESEKSGENKK